MADRETIEKLIRNAYAARAGKDLDNVMTFFAPDAAFQFAGSAAASPAAVHVQGAANLRATFGALIAAFDILELTLLTSVIEGDNAATLAREGTVQSNRGIARHRIVRSVDDRGWPRDPFPAVRRHGARRQTHGAEGVE
jgi:ketosteroid isomerase-like protein